MYTVLSSRNERKKVTIRPLSKPGEEKKHPIERITLRVELVVPIPLALLHQPTDCVVSLPLSLYTLSNVSHGAALHMQLRKLQSIQTGWTILSPSSESPLVLFKLQCLPPPAVHHKLCSRYKCLNTS